MDFGLLGRGRWLHTTLVAVVLVLGSLMLVALAIAIAVGEYHSFQLYWPGHPPIYAILLLRDSWRPVERRSRADLVPKAGHA